jgi:histidinol-phosphate/aromatic aminotransferase/cobyric acid decarboxylase-like protein
MSEQACAGGHARSQRIQVRLATTGDRQAIYRIRHQVYAQELHQHHENATEQLTDALDAFNLYIVVTLGEGIVGFISITPPGRSYSIDKYLSRQELPFPCDDGLYEVRLLTVLGPYRNSSRGTELAGLLIHAAFRWVEACGGQRIVAIGRREVLGLYLKVGLKPLGRTIQSGAVEFELISTTLDEAREPLSRYAPLLRYVEPEIDWHLAVPYLPDDRCFHGGTSIRAVGEQFDRLERRDEIIDADVLDAWFPPAPAVVAALQEHLPWLVRTSPPHDGAGLVSAIAEARGLDRDGIVLGAGSSDLIYRGLNQWLTPTAKVLLLDPTYGEYAHVCKRVIGCRVDRIPLRREVDYVADVPTLEAKLASSDYDLVILVNPNNPTGRTLDRDTLIAVLRRLASRTRVWVDEAYIDYVGRGQSLETFATSTTNVVVCKTLSKVYALSGMRAAYLAGPPSLMRELRQRTPPWVVGLPAQAAAVCALRQPGYYAECYRTTHAHRDELERGLRKIDPRMHVVTGSANFVLCHLSEEGPDATTVVSHCQARGLYLRDLSSAGTTLGKHAVRIAVKSRHVQERMLAKLQQVLHEAANDDIPGDFPPPRATGQ